MAKTNSSLPTCPCCRNLRHRTEATTAIGQLRALHRKDAPNIKESEAKTYSYFEGGYFYWACDPCIAAGKALKADTKRQNYRSKPRLAYSCTEHECKECNRSFLFPKTEKMFWYEERQFFIDSAPVACPECRKLIRHQKNENQELSDFLREGETGLSWDQLERIIEIYNQWGKPEKAKHFKSILKRKKR